MEIDDLRFHDLRHEVTSRLFEAGLSIERVALVTGHRDWKCCDVIRTSSRRICTSTRRRVRRPKRNSCALLLTASDLLAYHFQNGGPGGSTSYTENQNVSGWFANPFPSYSLIWSGEPNDQKEE
ncbi:hypothetical protein [Mesorhizobium sp. WSM2239]|uniref:Tyr recombinase domain-containing protein n=2 Tax=unclassified Mesorhizobium TaxID=325217 RepID=A0AAU8D417_9HYPH